MKEVKPGLEAVLEFTVGSGDLASVYGSGALAVYATPAMVGFMEKTACAVLEPYLYEGETTVGIAIDVKHIKPTLPGQRLICTAELVQVEGRKYVFDIEVSDTLSVVGTARHERFLVDEKEFLKKAEENKKACL